MSILDRLLPSFHRGRPQLYWVTSDIAISKAPVAGDWPAIREAGVCSVVDLRAEAKDNGAVVRGNELAYTRLPVEDFAAPSDQQLVFIAAWITDRVNLEGPVLIHCREGRGRSALVACAALVKLGFPPGEAYQMVRRARPDIVLSEAQSDALHRFALANDERADAAS